MNRPPDEADGFRTTYAPINGSGKTRITVMELSTGRQASEEARPSAISGGLQSIRTLLIRQLQRG